eukprot:COSAG06_NODE_2377_length_6984_cov_28.325635_8_plen_94_part_00
MRCSGAVLLRARRNGARYCTCKSTLLPTGPAWCTAWGLRALHQRGLVVHRRGWQAAGEAPTESLTLSRKISTCRSAERLAFSNFSLRKLISCG